MKVGNVEVTLHRTVRVQSGRVPSNLPPSLGVIKTYKVSDYAKKCPKSWESEAVFVALHDTEALWLSFSKSRPHAILVGAGGLNALTGEKLGTKLEPENYIVAPPQPWLDGWKSAGDGSVFQFVATPYQEGKGVTVAEQVIGKDSKTGAIGLAVFEPKDRSLGETIGKPSEGWGTSPTDDDFNWTGTLGPIGESALMSISDNSIGYANSSSDFTEDSSNDNSLTMASLKSEVKSSLTSEQHPILKSAHATKTSSLASPQKFRKSRSSLVGRSTSGIGGSAAAVSFNEMGIGKGGKIHQKIYPDPYGLEAWEDAPSAVMAIYVVDARTFEQITGEKVPMPKDHSSYSGIWFGLQDSKLEDVKGSEVFTGLKDAFAGDTSNIATAVQETKSLVKPPTKIVPDKKLKPLKKKAKSAK